MKVFLVDSNVILDLFLDDPQWAAWSEERLDDLSHKGVLLINPVIYSEVSIGFKRIEDLESAISRAGFVFRDLPREALFLAGKAFLEYKKNQGAKSSPLPDFYIGAHAAVLGMQILTRDVSRYITYFPSVELISP